MKLVFVRHALPERVENATIADPPLAEAGRVQAQRLVRHLRADAIDVIVSSPALRAVQTAEPLAEARELKPLVVEGLAEYDAEETSYVPFDELRALGDERWQRLARGEFHTPHVDPVAFRQRIVEEVERIVEHNPRKNVVITTHAGVINAYIGHVLGQSLPLWFAPGYVSVSRVKAGRDGRRGIESLNEQCRCIE